MAPDTSANEGALGWGAPPSPGHPEAVDQAREQVEHLQP